MSELHISISAQPIFNIGGFEVTNSMAVSLGVSIFLVLLAILANRHLRKVRPPRWVVFLQVLTESFYDFVQGIAPQHGKKFFPIVASLFIFILLGNWAGLLPGAESIGFNGPHGYVPYIRGATADLNITLGLAIFAMTAVQVYGYKIQGAKYFGKFFNFTNPINFFVGFLELISEFSKVLSFAFRLFGNIFAGEVLLAVIAFLVPVFASLPFIGLELFVGLIQALVFSTLTLVFINMATEHH
jgi:F-type H+-transporting ATPase subunit a